MSDRKDPNFIFGRVNVPTFSILFPVSSKGGDHFKRTDDLVCQSIWV